MLDDKNVLDAQKVFVSMALINILKTPLSQLPFAISTTLQVGCISSPSLIEEIIFTVHSLTAHIDHFISDCFRL